ncbi:Arc family DNA-binding protein [Stenotrophomonas acidaminiphila]|uniref:Arc family DNA-binding protein n=1 Tax=Stenotrophomonas acidaminiphila TaxID=128780 RepID=UPI003D0415C2
MSEPAFHQFKLRLPLALFRELEAAADTANRSVSAEIVHRLEQSFAIADSPEKEIHLSRQQFDSLMESMRDQIAEHLAWSPEAIERFKGAKK